MSLNELRCTDGNSNRVWGERRSALRVLGMDPSPKDHAICQLDSLECMATEREGIIASKQPCPRFFPQIPFPKPGGFLGKLRSVRLSVTL